MEISEQELRVMIRDAIARRGEPGPERAGGSTAAVERAASGTGAHGSHGLFTALPATGGECLIEPSVRCHHCGYCKSLGH